MFCVNEKVVYPGHGVAQITNHVVRSFGEEEALFYELTFLSKGMTVLVPLSNAKEVGLRLLTSQEEVTCIMALLSTPCRHAEQVINWARRNKEYQVKLKRGDLQELSAMYRELHHLAVHKELSFGEKNLLTQIEQLLVEELALVKDVGHEKMLESLRTLCMAQAQKAVIAKML